MAFTPKNDKSYTLEEARKKLEYYCAYQERCHQEVTRKLREMKMIPEAIDQIIVHLIEENFLNETRFAQSFARGKFRIKKWGRQRISNELKKRSISKFNIKIGLKEILEEEYQSVFFNLLDQKKTEYKHLPLLEQKKKIQSYFVYRGWEYELISEGLNSLE
ncbi:MAG: RecX family transcriptional regulator [Flavobacteriaceae bacterium]|nr:RecX family transcriptional regulator [Flavobacteriaceae bacterium]